MSNFLPCPFCGAEPVFEGNGECWHDDYRYIEMKIECSNCCVSIYEIMGWVKAREMSIEEREVQIKSNLIAKWNTRFTPEVESEIH